MDEPETRDAELGGGWDAALLRAALDAVGDAVIAVDERGRVARMNRAAEELTGASAAAALGRPLEEVYRARPRPPAPGRARGGEPGAARGVTLTRGDGAERDLSEAVVPIEAADGRVIGRVLALRDVTAALATDRNHERARRLESLGELASGVAHDFSNMLTGIVGAADLLALEVEGDAAGLVELILETSQKAADLTAKLLSFARSGRHERDSVDVHRVVRDVCAVLTRDLDARVELVTRLDADETKLVGDHGELVAAVLHLGFNARDAMEGGGTLTITTENVVLDEHYCTASPFALTPGEYVQLTVRDTGHGMDARTLERAFEPFFTTKPAGVGAGLGLPAVYGAVTRHRGALAVYSEAGTGSVFHLFLPVQRGLVIAAYQPSDEELGRGEGVLVVDDEEIVRETARLLLESLGYRVFLAAHGEAGIEQFVAHQEAIDVVLLDMIMPRMNGRECFEKLRRVDPGVRVLMSSGFTPEAVERDSVTSGVTGFLKKPYRMSELGAALRAVLEPRQAPH